MQKMLLTFDGDNKSALVDFDKETQGVYNNGRYVGRIFNRKSKNIIGIIGDNGINYFILRGNRYCFIGTDKEFDLRPTILVSTVDGVGNQMMQYAFALYLHKLGKNVKIDPRWYRQTNAYREELLSRFELLPEVPFCNKYEACVFPFIKQEDNKDMIFEFDWENFNDECNLFGYWQDYRYIKGNEKDLIKAFTLKKDIGKENKDLLNIINKYNSVAIHIRRGDYFSYPERYNILTKEYYKKAIEIIKQKVKDPFFFCFGEDQSWIRANLPLNYNEFICVNNNLTKEEDCIFDLELMKNCDHQIIANSTFSLMAATLNGNEDKVVIAPEDWGKSFVKTINNHEWIRI